MYISIDVGTTNLKMTLIDSEYQVHGQKSYRYMNTQMTQVNFEMDMEEIWKYTIEGIESLAEQIDQKTPTKIILTTAMHSLILLDQNKKPLTPIYAWNDARGHEEIDKLSKEKKTELYQRTGTPIHSMNPYFKLDYWLQRFDRKYILVGSIKDVLYYRLTGEWLIDEASASASGIYNVKQKQWDTIALKELGITKEQLPVIGPSKKQLPTHPNLIKEATVFLGTTDGVASNYACRSLDDSAVLTIGTSHAVRVIATEVKSDLHSQNFCYHIQDDEYLLGYPSNNGGNIIEWIVDNYATTFDELDNLAIQNIQPEVTFLPFLNGERSPIWDDQAMAEIQDIHRSVTREELLYSMLCGTFFNMRHNLENLSQQAQFSRLCLVGGIMNSGGLVQLIANIMGMDIYVPVNHDAERLGSVALIRGEEVALAYEKIPYNLESHQMLDGYYKRYREKMNTEYKTK